MIVAFDFDGTITTKDTFIAFIKFAKGNRFFYQKLYIIIYYWFLSKLSIITTNNAKQRVFKHLFEGNTLTEFNKWCELFKEKIDTLVREGVLEKIKAYKKLNYKVIIVSASIENWIQPWAINNSIDMVIATKIGVTPENKLSGQFATLNCKGIEKVNRLKEKFPNIRGHNLIVYGDSSGDKELINLAGKEYYKYFG